MMTAANRIAGAGRLAGKPVRFTFDGQRYRRAARATRSPRR